MGSAVNLVESRRAMLDKPKDWNDGIRQGLSPHIAAYRAWTTPNVVPLI